MRLLLLIAFIPLFSVIASAQKLTGQVVDQALHQPIVGATVQVKRTQAGTLTSSLGTFTLSNLQPADVLTFSYLGYQTQEVTYTGQTSLAIELVAGVSLNEVVVTALGLERNARSLGYAIQKVDGRQVSDVKAPNFLDNLSGKVAGVMVTGGSTGVGASSRITIRGESSFTNNNPLFVVDGIVINNATVVNRVDDDANGFQEIDFGNGAMEINPDDVAAVSVLKGPGAAALYGTRASNGVILITTKDGSSQKGIGVSFNSTFYTERPFQLPRFQNLYGQGNSGAFKYVNGLGGGINDNISYSYGPKLDAGLLIQQYDSPVNLPDGRVVRGADTRVYSGLPITPTPFVSHPDNLKNFYETGHTAINNLAISGSYDKGSYRLSYTDLNSQSTIPGVDLKRKTLAARLQFEPIKRLKFSSSLNYINTGSDNRPATKYGSENINYALSAWLGRQTDVNPMKQYWQPGLEGIQQFSYNYTYFDNPYFTLYENRNSFNRDRLIGNLAVTGELATNLTLMVRSGMDYSSENRQFRRAFSSNRFKNGAYAENAVFFREINTDFLLNYTRSLGALSLDLSAGGNRMDQLASFDQFQALTLAQPGVFKLTNAASPVEAYQQSARKRINSLYALAKLSYKDVLFMDITGRNDWSSSLATPTSTANTSFFYPSVSTSWVLSNQFQLPAVVSFAKVRASVANVGNDTSPYQTTGVYNARNPVFSQPAFSAQSTIANTNLKPESITSFEVGADVRFLNDRLGVDLTYYDARTRNQILSLPIAIPTGYSERVINGGEVRSQGIEAVVTAAPIQTSRVRWNVSLNFSRNRTYVVSLPEEAGTLTLGYNRIYDNVNQTVWYQVRQGDRMGDMWGTGYLRNAQGEFIVGSNGQYIADNTLKKLGNYNPDFMIGLSNQLSVGNWNMGFLLDWRQGGILVSRTLALAGVAGQLIETANRPDAGIVAKGVVNTGTTDNPNYQPNTVAIPAETYYRMYYDRNNEENNTYNASYVKLREMSIGYTLPETAGLARKLHMQRLTIALVGRNLMALSHIPHFDPEQTSFQQNQLQTGVEDMTYPSSRNIGVKLSVNF
ncbi:MULTISPECIES: SusC/RagA family TonB-linked outer membrane protein [unclassified Spirosoma]|uniref:SusC/RagA family TonB-linked outer membrane protein n=1 Tax=unclassified Spirosoma TaxID=2621999 RepID=UPI00095DCA16|nr:MULTISPECIES: SusC/RagA family TonB-linked outer membrane protein [unclassified Spirosoma]MBN8825406.1 SusC/RagA family TonB-linked outer membrane protein [Spirosoma sp.]OJW74917.1 MAG: SusC/RagA family TonB-linked outer membrane protein [Spirosoma sp. 48-14]